MIIRRLSPEERIMVYMSCTNTQVFLSSEKFLTPGKEVCLCANKPHTLTLLPRKAVFTCLFTQLLHLTKLSEFTLICQYATRCYYINCPL